MISRVLNVVVLSLVGIFVLLVLRTSSHRSPESPDDGAKMEQARVEVQRLAEVVLTYANAHKALPQRFGDLIPEYLESEPRDPYGRPYLLLSNGEAGTFVTYRGKDGKAKGYVERDMDVSVYIRNNRGVFVIGTE